MQPIRNLLCPIRYRVTLETVCAINAGRPMSVIQRAPGLPSETPNHIRSVEVQDPSLLVVVTMDGCTMLTTPRLCPKLPRVGQHLMTALGGAYSPSLREIKQVRRAYDAAVQADRQFNGTGA